MKKKSCFHPQSLVKFSNACNRYWVSWNIQFHHDENIIRECFRVTGIRFPVWRQKQNCGDYRMILLTWVENRVLLRLPESRLADLQHWVVQSISKCWKEPMWLTWGGNAVSLESDMSLGLYKQEQHLVHNQQCWLCWLSYFCNAWNWRSQVCVCPPSSGHSLYCFNSQNLDEQ